MVDTVLTENNESLTASELRYRRLFESAKDGILILDAETGYIQDVNPFLVGLLGYSRDEFIDKTIWDIGFFGDIVSSKENFEQLKEQKYIRYEDLPLETSDGRKIDVEFVSNVYEEGDHTVIQCNIRDITERKRTADTLAAERERLAVTLRCISDGVITTDIHGTVVHMNLAAENICGWKKEDVQEKPLLSFFSIIDENTRAPCENPVEKALASSMVPEPQNNTILIAKDGSERMITYGIAPLIDGKNSTIGVVLVFRDITERHKLMEAMHNNKRLEALGLLAAGIAHDFNNLMGGIFGFIDLAKEESTDEIVNGYLSKASQTIDRARALTLQFLTFAKGGVPAKTVGNLIALVKDTTLFALGKSNIPCHFQIPDDLWDCSFDKNQIVQVIDNIVINAKQAMSADGMIDVTARNVTLEADKHPILVQGRYVKISITDNGIGIPKELIGRIFDPFFSTKKTGHGLGLSTCYSIIKKHGGSIDVDSDPGTYTTFHIFLPAITGSGIPVQDRMTVQHKGSGTFLLMDDEAMLRDTTGDLLKSFGYSVVCTKNGREAIDYVTSSTISDLSLAGIMLDLTAPGDMGGKEIVEEIRKSTVKTPVFIMSGYVDDPVMKDPVRYGFTAGICKPFRKGDLSEMLNRYMLTMT